MSNEIVKQDWYKNLVEECKAIITEAVFTSRWVLVEGYWNLGKRIREEKILQKGEYGEAHNILQDLAESIGTSTRTINYSLQAYDKYPDISKLPEGKNLTWNKLITKYLPSTKATEEVIIPEDNHFICPRCGYKFTKEEYQRQKKSIKLVERG